jgi:ankyrin repeat protein
MEATAMKNDWHIELDATGQTPLSRAARCGRMEFTTLMLVQNEEDKPNKFRELPTLHRAACWGFADVVSDLIDEGADADERDCQGETALHKAVRLGNAEAALALIERGAMVDAQDSLGMTPLHWAALTGNPEMTEMLLAHYANVDVCDYFCGGMTPRDIARVMGHKDIIEMMTNRFALY